MCFKTFTNDRKKNVLNIEIVISEMKQTAALMLGILGLGAFFV